LNAIFLIVGYAGQVEVATWCRRYGKVIDLFLELGVAEKEAERRAEVVQLFGFDALNLRIALGVEPGVLPV